jgi:hypothetical protein
MPYLVDRIEPIEGVLGMNRPFLYFGYGLESVPEVMDELLGRVVTVEVGVTAVKRQLCIQEIDQVPDEPAEAFGGKSPQAILAETWQRFTDVPFASYVLLETENRGDVVSGSLSELNIEDMLKLNNWNLTAQPVRNAPGSQHPFSYPGWRYLDNLVELADGRQVSTLTIYPEQQVDRVVPGTDYEPFLNDRSTTMHVIHSVASE